MREEKTVPFSLGIEHAAQSQGVCSSHEFPGDANTAGHRSHSRRKERARVTHRCHKAGSQLLLSAAQPGAALNPGRSVDECLCGDRWLLWTRLVMGLSQGTSR